MKTDDDIRDFFHANRPVPSDESQFMDSLEKNMSVAVLLREMHRRERKRSRRLIAAASCCGLIAGALIAASYAYLPIHAESLITAAETSIASLSRPVISLELAALARQSGVWLFSAAILAAALLIPHRYVR